MLTPAIAASSGSAPFDNISCARATPRSPFADAMTVGREARHAVAIGRASTLPTPPSDNPAAAAAPVPRKRRRDREDIGGLMRVDVRNLCRLQRDGYPPERGSGVRGQGWKGAAAPLPRSSE